MDWKPFNCNVCGKSFSQQANLADHQNIHYGNRPFQCKQCKKTFNNRGAYYNHMRIHNDDRFYVCPLCNANFMWELSMKTHLYRHQRNGEISAKMVYCTLFGKNATSLPQNHQKQQATNNDDYNSKGNGIYNEVPNMKASEIPNYENLENWMCEASSTGTSTYANETSSHLLNERTPNSRINENPTLQFQDTNQTRNLYQNQFPWNTDREEKQLLTYHPYDSMHRTINYTEMENFPSDNNKYYSEKNCFFENSHQNNYFDYPLTKESDAKDLMKAVVHETTSGKVSYSANESFSSTPTVSNLNNSRQNLIQENDKYFCYPKSNQNQFSEDITALNFHNYATNNGSEDSPQFKKENEARAYMGKNYYDTSFYEQPNASLYTKEESQTEYSPNLNRTYENNMANYIHEIPQNTPSQQQFNTQQPFHYTFGEQNNFQNVNALGIINDHAYNANYAYYQQNSPQETFNQQFIPQIEGILFSNMLNFHLKKSLKFIP
ncbi:Neurotrophin receptor-interacting factor -like protein [Trichinella pseudospiralis]|uniref:Neurotrophin receptor-interacting factor-like protein n=1 Tax=Trichinella pseudospiralis TaxID=6337 RepID=A0A0V1E496_TRIPS|nr:Neurotrophin receptor-interacting factor -like protein [Trichinella pseudospiralis]